MPANIVRDARTKKAILLEAFKDDIPEELLVRPKARPQDSTGITNVLSEHIEKTGVNFKQMLLEHFEKIKAT